MRLDVNHWNYNCMRASDETLLGKDGFRKGMDMYFERHDGEAVTCDDFLAAMADANGEDLSLMSKCVPCPTEMAYVNDMNTAIRWRCQSWFL